jgi:hypothetical protein
VQDRKNQIIGRRGDIKGIGRSIVRDPGRPEPAWVGLQVTVTPYLWLSGTNAGDGPAVLAGLSP